MVLRRKGSCYARVKENLWPGVVASEVEAGGSGIHGYPHPYNEFKTTLNYTTNTPKEPYKVLSGTWLLGRLRQEDRYKLKTSLSYVENSRSVRATVYTLPQKWKKNQKVKVYAGFSWTESGRRQDGSPHHSA